MADYEVDILVNGKPIRQFRYKGDHFVEGRKGSNFELKFTNNTWKRVEVVPSVDGLDVIDGEECGTESSGYVVNARDSVTIPGWRLDNDTVAEFIFKDKKKSYASRSGKGTANVGAIGFMVFEEKQYVYIPPINPSPPWTPYPHPWDNPWIGRPYGIWTGTSSVGSISNTTSDTNVPINHNQKGIDKVDLFENDLTEEDFLDPEESIKTVSDSDSLSVQRMGASLDSLGSNAITASADAEVFNIGVGFGDEQDHSVHEVSFQRDNVDYPTETLVIYYDSRKGLENRGIRVVKTKKRKLRTLPNPFPTYSSGSGCRPPPGWKSRK